MNTITLTVGQRVARAKSYQALFSKAKWSTILLACLVLASSMSLVYLKDLNRRLFINYQNLQAKQAQTYTNWGKLLLEQSTWEVQARVQNIAENKLGMEVPSPKQVVMINVDD